ncbi:HSPB1-associated protein 1 homolog isoform X1 [Halyomorpha halys]|uniref:HSPB1-associated protein 1 homolog isoform X1 n=2 Tax=Halyomorpha halys TaxID=286706 RepID=UPI0006D4DDCD|nr:HSPB1-associated protein 1 homolog isoform X2 [Halyomorpha halys]
MSSEKITSSEIPLLFKNSLHWNILNWSVDEWNAFLNDSSVKYPFRVGSMLCSRDPQWERNCEVADMTFSDFFKKFNEKNNPKNWWYFDYKHIEEWLREKADKMDINWKDFGHPEITAKGSTLWIGTKGAHTPCHIDTYGCNLVAQLYGKKRWILFPPSETNNLKPSRIPYEESSIYSQINFFCGCSDFSEIKNIYVVDLEPGDVLFVPFHWWHYVENLSSAISVNTWISCELDDVCRVEESLVKYFISSVCKNVSSEEIKLILNPNEDDLPNTEEVKNLQELSWCLNQCSEMENKMSPNDSESNYGLKKITPEVFIESLKLKCKDNFGVNMSVNNNLIRNDVINAFCHPEVITLVRKKLQNFPV